MLKIEFYLRPKLERLVRRLAGCVLSADKQEPSYVIIDRQSKIDDIKSVLYFYRTAKGYRDTALFVNGKLTSQKQAQSVIVWLQCLTNKYDNPAYCFLTPDLHGWGCKHLYSVQRHEAFGSHRGIEWYRVGPFENGIQYIDKEEIKSILQAESESKCLDLCPFFSLPKAISFVNLLPEQIDPRKDSEWIYTKSQDIVNLGIPVGVEPAEKMSPLWFPHH